MVERVEDELFNYGIIGIVLLLSWFVAWRVIVYLNNKRDEERAANVEMGKLFLQSNADHQITLEKQAKEFAERWAAREQEYGKRWSEREREIADERREEIEKIVNFVNSNVTLNNNLHELLRQALRKES